MSNSSNQDSEGLLSPWIRDIRLKAATSAMKQCSLVLDLACGSGALSKHLPQDCQYVGIDIVEPPDRQVFDAFHQLDIMDPATLYNLAEVIPARPDAIFLIAFVEHIKEPAKLLSAAHSLLAPGGVLVMTTPHPVGRDLHDFLAKIGICSQSAAEEHESFLGRDDLLNMCSEAGYVNVTYKRFLLGLNQLLSAQKAN